MLKRFTIGLGLAVALVVGGASAETPRRGGTIRFTAPYAQNFSGLDIHASALTQDMLWGKAMHRSLYEWDPIANASKLELATDVTVSPDGMTYTYKLRQDAYFHHGRRMTADDIIWSYTRIMSPTAGFPGAKHIRTIKGAIEVEKGLEGSISGLRKIDDFTLEITLAEKVNPAHTFDSTQVSIYPADEAAKESFFTRPVGLGPFKFVEHVPGSRMGFERWDKYYEPGKPYVDKLLILAMVDAAARDIAFRNREIDVAVLGAPQYVAYKADPVLSKSLVEVAEMFTRHMGMNPRFPPFSDKRVRQAINHAIDADLIIERLLKGKAYRATGWLSPATPAYDEDSQPYAYDPEKAKKLLAEAGYANGFTFEWSATKHESIGSHIAEAIVPMLEKVGIKLKIKPIESTMLGEIQRSGNFQAYGGSNATGPDPERVLRCFHSATPQTACNFMLFNNPDFDALLDEAGAVNDPARKLKLLAQANKLLMDEAPVWFFNYSRAVMARQPWLHGVVRNAAELTAQSYEDLWVDETSPAM